MRIIGGQFKRRKLSPPPNARVSRPMPDRVKEAVFNLLRGHVEGAEVFEAFAGVGTIGLEAASRGASRVVMVEKDRTIARILRENAATLGLSDDEVEIVNGDALGTAALARCPQDAHLVFYDPPYVLLTDPARRERTLRQLAALIQKLDKTGYAVLRTPWPLPVDPEDPQAGDTDLTLDGAEGPETHVYGSMAIHLYMRRA